MENTNSKNSNTNPKSNNGNSTNPMNDYKVKLMCSYGGKIQPRPNSNQLMYFGGDTKILTVDHNIKFSELVTRLNSLISNSPSEFRIKYQLPGEDLDALVSLIDDDDVDHMMFEYDRIVNSPTKAAARIRLFLFNVNNKNPVLSPGSDFPLNPDFLFGFDKDYVPSSVEKQNLNTGDNCLPPALDLLQIPGMVVPGYSGSGQDNGNAYEVRVENSSNHMVSGSYVKNVYRIPVVTGVGHGGYCVVQGVVPGMGNWEQPVYNYIAAMPSVPEQKTMVPTGGEQMRQ